MAKLSNEFFEAAEACTNVGAAKRLMECLEEYKDTLLQELVMTDDEEKVLRLQGSIRTLLEILEGFYSADEYKRRIDKHSKGRGPSLKTIT